MLDRPLHLAVAAAVVWAAVGCTGDDEPAPGSESQTSSPAATGSAPSLTEQDAALKVSIEQLNGGIKRKQRPALKRVISKPIAAWIRHGYSDVSSSGGSYRKAFAGWTGDAATLARRDDDVTTNILLGEDLSGVVISKSRARLYVFARKGLTGGATARVRLRLLGERQDGSSTSYVVTGELYLTRRGNTWQVFGYDLGHREVR